MAVRPTITFSYYWDREEPDGSECFFCGDRCYLKMWRLMLRIIGKRGRRSPTAHVLCDSCHQASMES